MLKLALGLMVLFSQLSGPGGGLPQILQPDFKATAPIKAGKRGEVTVSLTALKGDRKSTRLNSSHGYISYAVFCLKKKKKKKKIITNTNKDEQRTDRKTLYAHRYTHQV